MLGLLAPKKLDSRRAFSNLERQAIFFRDEEMCQWSKMKGTTRRVLWDESEIHHVIPYASSGKTDIRNAALVHRDFHPKSDADVVEFREWWEQHNINNESPENQPQNNRHISPPDGTKIKMSYRSKEYFGEYQGGKIVLTGEGGELAVVCTSLSDASKEVTGTSRNGWFDWCFLDPGQDQWVPADDWRKDMETIYNT